MCEIIIAQLTKQVKNTFPVASLVGLKYIYIYVGQTLIFMTLHDNDLCYSRPADELKK